MDIWAIDYIKNIQARRLYFFQEFYIQFIPLLSSDSIIRCKMGIIAWVLFGLIIGIVAHLMDPRPTQGGVVGTAILGIAGALLGGFVSSLVFGTGVMGFNFSSFAVAALASLLVLLIVRVVEAE